MVTPESRHVTITPSLLAAGSSRVRGPWIARLRQMMDATDPPIALAANSGSTASVMIAAGAGTPIAICRAPGYAEAFSLPWGGA